MLKMLLIAGHGESDPGALGNGYREAERNRAIVTAMHDCFFDADVELHTYDMNKSCYKQIKSGNVPDFSQYHYVCEVHLNASVNPSANGSMVYISQSETGHSVEDRILENLYRLGFAKAWDGVVVAQRQWKNGLLVQETCRRAGVSHTLLETCFITNEADMARLNNNILRVAQAIADGIIDGFHVRRKDSSHSSGKIDSPETADSTLTFVPYMAKVTAPALNIRSGPGINYTINGIIADQGTYTITAEADGPGASKWGRLKSGAGWISLDYTKQRG